MYKQKLQSNFCRELEYRTKGLSLYLQVFNGFKQTCQGESSIWGKFIAALM